MHSRIMLLSLCLHGVLIVGAAVWVVEAIEQPRELRLAVVPPSRDLPAEASLPPAAPPRPEREADDAPLAEPELPVPDRRFDLQPPPEDLGPWPAAREPQWTPAALVKLESPSVEAPSPQPPAPLVRATLRDGHNAAPDYPRAAVRRRLEGTVVLRLQVGVDGGVRHVEVVRSCDHSILDSAAVEAARSWQFEPATRGGRPVPDLVTKRVRFELRTG